MASKLKIKVNGLVHSVTASLDTPLLYVLHNELHLHGPRFGCGLAQCGACSVLLDGKEIRSCVTPVAAVSGKGITTLEGLPALWAKERGTAAASPALHPLQQAWIDVQVPHCGYCQNGMMIQAADLLFGTWYWRTFGRLHRAALAALKALPGWRQLAGAMRLWRIRYLCAWRVWKYDPRYRRAEAGGRMISFAEPMRLWWRGDLDRYIGRPLLAGGTRKLLPATDCASDAGLSASQAVPSTPARRP